MDRLCDAGINKPAIDWLWQGYLARGSLTLLTSLWKAGKTTLLTGLLQRLGSGGDFLGQACVPARALVVSEESREHWAERLRTMPIGPPDAGGVARADRARAGIAGRGRTGPVCGRSVGVVPAWPQ